MQDPDSIPVRLSYSTPRQPADEPTNPDDLAADLNAAINAAAQRRLLINGCDAATRAMRALGIPDQN